MVHQRVGQKHDVLILVETFVFFTMMLKMLCSCQIVINFWNQPYGQLDIIIPEKRMWILQSLAILIALVLFSSLFLSKVLAFQRDKQNLSLKIVNRNDSTILIPNGLDNPSLLTSKAVCIRNQQQFFGCIKFSVLLYQAITNIYHVYLLFFDQHQSVQLSLFLS